jgi:hypothetical protein
MSDLAKVIEEEFEDVGVSLTEARRRAGRTLDELLAESEAALRWSPEEGGPA